MAAQIADLELSLLPQAHGYRLMLRFTRHGDAGDKQYGPFVVAIDVAALRALSLSPDAYGAALAAALFGDPAAAAAFAEARAVALSAREQLRVRLLLPAELQALWWETLRDPSSGRPLATEGAILLSRYLTSDDYQPVALRGKGLQRALIGVAAPTNAAEYRLALIDGAAEVMLASNALQLPLTRVLGAADSALLTFAALSDELRSGCDLLYLLAHGALIDGQPWVYLAGADGRADPVAASRLADLARALGERRPQLAILASCESAGDGQASALAALGPLLVQAGIPAVVAMHGRLGLDTARQLLPVFLVELRRDGCVDRALAVARLFVSERPDWWVPVLYSRMRAGQIWDEAAAPPPAPQGSRGLPASTLGALRQTLLLCDEFESQRRLRAVFSAHELRPWQGGLPEADSMSERVELTISYLLEKRNRQGQGALPLLLQALGAARDADDELSASLRGLARLIG